MSPSEPSGEADGATDGVLPDAERRRLGHATVARLCHRQHSPSIAPAIDGSRSVIVLGVAAQAFVE